MGWCNYIIIPKLKLIVEASRSVDEERTESFLENFKDFIKEIENFNYEILERKLNEIDIKDFSKVVSLSESADLTFSDFYHTFALVLFLNFYNIDYKIISEFNLKKEKYKDYKFVYLT